MVRWMRSCRWQQGPAGSRLAGALRSDALSPAAYRCIQRHALCLSQRGRIPTSSPTQY